MVKNWQNVSVDGAVDIMVIIINLTYDTYDTIILPFQFGILSSEIVIQLT